MRYRRVVLVFLLISAVLAAEWVWLNADKESAPDTAGPIITGQAQAPGGPFALVDHNGQAVSDRTYRGKYLVMLFGYTHCPDICPTTLTSVSSALDLLGRGGEEVQPVFVTVDPERDTPAALAEYVTAIDPRLVGLTGTPAQIRDVARAYRVYYSKVDTGDGDYPVDHSAYLYVVGPDGKTLTYLRHDATPQAIADAIERAMSLKMSGRRTGLRVGAAGIGPG